MSEYFAQHRGCKPVLGSEVFIADNARVLGDVVLGDRSSVWFAATVRGDVQAIRIGARTSVQDGATVHVTRNTGPTQLGDDVTIGHNAVLHACAIEDQCLVGIGAIVLDRVVLGRGSMVGAGALVSPGTVIPPRSLVVGVPGRVVRQVRDDELAWLLENAEHYAKLARAYLDDLAT